MKILLTILCALMVLFAGGCALLVLGGNGLDGVLSAGPFVLILAGIACLNLMVLGALWGFAKPSKPAFLTLVVLDAIVVVVIGFFWAEMGLGDEELNMLVAVTMAAFAAKGLLTYFLAQEA
jgi:hypothetical protein